MSLTALLVGAQTQAPAISTTMVPTVTASNQTSNCSSTTTKPAADVQKYSFKTCIVAQFATHFMVSPGKFIDFGKGKVNENNSSCDNKTDASVQPKLAIDFPCASLTLNIGKTNDSKIFVKSFAGEYKLVENSTQVDYTFSNSTPTFYTTLMGHYYKCNSEQEIPMTPSGQLVFSNFALEAYREVPTTEFYQIAEECLLDNQPVSDLVRIGVGICLVALVAIVLIAYFIGRRRWSERSSYESV